MSKKIFLAFLAFSFLLAAALHAEPGADVRAAFANARAGQPLRCVFLGGSITQAGEGWIADWLKQTFPQSRVSIVNSGMSATGSDLGVFRLDRDVVAYQPDLVAIEYCVNDSGLSDEEAIRSMESIIVRLKQQPHAPAIVILEAAANGGVNLARHRRVAQHYGLVEVDLQKAVDERLKETGAPWATYFKDNVHPNDSGNQLYAKAIAQTLAPYVVDSGSKSTPKTPAALPAKLSAKPLLLDARMVSFSGFAAAPGWNRENSLPFWWDRFFNGVLSADKPGSTLTIPVRATTVGLYYAMDKSYGTFFASVDESLPLSIDTNFRGGYSHCLLARDLPPGEHRLSIVLPAQTATPGAGSLNGPVKLGYILLAGEGQAAEAPQGPYSPERVARLRFTSIPGNRWQWSGPYGAPAPGETQATPILQRMNEIYAPENAATVIDWKAGPDMAEMDFCKLTGDAGQNIAYATANIPSPEAREILLAVACDYYAKIWVNGALAASILTPHGASTTKTLIPVHLQAGDNQLLIKIGAGSGGFNLAVGTME